MITLSKIYPRKLTHGLSFGIIGLCCVLFSMIAGFYIGDWASAYVLSLCALTFTS